MERHLGDMREWYRRKLRELAGDPAGRPGRLRPAGRAAAGDGEKRPTCRRRARSTLLALTDEVEPADRQLGELLRSLELVDADTLQGAVGRGADGSGGRCGSCCWRAAT